MKTVEVLSVTALAEAGEGLWGQSVDIPTPGSVAPGSAIRIGGWVLGRHSPATAVELCNRGATVRRLPLRVVRPDVARVFSHVLGAERSGFDAVLPLAATGDYELELRVVLGNEERVAFATIRARCSSEHNGSPDEYWVGAPSPDRRYFIRPDYYHRRRPRYFADDEAVNAGVVWQPDVYRDAGRIAAQLGVSRIVDIGCGQAQKLVELYPRFEIIGIDFGPNIEVCRRMFPFGTWIEHDLDDGTPIPVPPGASDQRTLLICADVIEHVLNPDRLLIGLRAALDGASALLVSTPERDLTRGLSDLGPPENEAHAREWSFEEFAEFVRWAGFTTGHISLTRSNDQDRDLHTILAVLFPNAAGGRLHVRVWRKRLLLIQTSFIHALKTVLPGYKEPPIIPLDHAAVGGDDE